MSLFLSAFLLSFCSRFLLFFENSKNQKTKWNPIKTKQKKNVPQNYHKRARTHHAKLCLPLPTWPPPLDDERWWCSQNVNVVVVFWWCWWWRSRRQGRLQWTRPAAARSNNLRGTAHSLQWVFLSWLLIFVFWFCFSFFSSVCFPLVALSLSKLVLIGFFKVLFETGVKWLIKICVQNLV